MMHKPMTTRRRRRRAARRIETALLIATLGVSWALVDVTTTVHEDGSFSISGCIARQLCDDRPGR